MSPRRAEPQLHCFYSFSSGLTKQVCERQDDGVNTELCDVAALGLNPGLLSVWPGCF